MQTPDLSVSPSQLTAMTAPDPSPPLPPWIVEWTDLWWGRCQRVEATPQGQMKLMALIVSYMAQLPQPYRWNVSCVDAVAQLTGVNQYELLGQAEGILQRDCNERWQRYARKATAARRTGEPVRSSKAVNLQIVGIPDLYLAQVLERHDHESEVPAPCPGDMNVRREEAKELAAVLATVDRELRRDQGAIRRSRHYIVQAVRPDFSWLHRKIDQQKLRRILQQLETMDFINLNNGATEGHGPYITTLFTYGNWPARMPWWFAEASGPDESDTQRPV